MSKYQKNNLIRNSFILVGIFLVIVFIFVVIIFMARERRQERDELVITEPAPASALYGVRGGLGAEVSGGVSVRIGGREYVVMPDGTVWERGEDGALRRVTEPAVINEALTRALSGGAGLDSGILSGRVSLADLTDSQITAFAETFGLEEGELREMVRLAREERLTSGTDGPTLSDALRDLDVTRLSDEELIRLAEELGQPLTKVREIVARAQGQGRSLSRDGLQEELANAYLEDWVSNGLKALGERNPGVDAKDVLDAMASLGVSGDEAMVIVSDGGFGRLLERLGLKEREEASSVSDERKGGVVGNLSDSGYRDPEETDISDVRSEVAREISFLQGLGNAGSQSSGGSAGSQSPAVAAGQAGEYERQNGQAAKSAFLQEFRTGSNVKRISDNSRSRMLVMGTPVKATLVTGLNTDLPGQITAIVSENVYDSFTKTNILIPKFSRLVATYDSAVTWGQRRVLIAWTNLIRPDGVLIDLNGYAGVDRMGYSGQGGEVDNHIASLIGATAMASLVNVATGEINKTDTENVLLSALLTGTMQGVNSASANLLNRHINRQPTILVEPGTKIVILTNDNIELPVYDEDWERR